MISELNSKQFLEMLISGKDNLEKHVDEVNALNDLPIPDHDTGTNMLHTMMYALDDIQYTDDIGDLALRISIRMSVGAKGKSGEVLARFFDGFVEPLEQRKTHLDSRLLKYAFQDAWESVGRYNLCYANCIPAIMQIIEIMIDAAERLSGRNDLSRMMYRMIADAQEHVKEINITDAGCIGLLYVIEGMSLYLMNYHNK